MWPRLLGAGTPANPWEPGLDQRHTSPHQQNWIKKKKKTKQNYNNEAYFQSSEEEMALNINYHSSVRVQ